MTALTTRVCRLHAKGDIRVETDPVGGPEQGAYLNLVVQLDTPLDARALLEVAGACEQEAERVRDTSSAQNDMVQGSPPPGAVEDERRMHVTFVEAELERFRLRERIDMMADRIAIGE